LKIPELTGYDSAWGIRAVTRDSLHLCILIQHYEIDNQIGKPDAHLAIRNRCVQEMSSIFYNFTTNFKGKYNTLDQDCQPNDRLSPAELLPIPLQGTLTPEGGKTVHQETETGERHVALSANGPALTSIPFPIR